MRDLLNRLYVEYYYTDWQWQSPSIITKIIRKPISFMYKVAHSTPLGILKTFKRYIKGDLKKDKYTC